MLFDEAIRAASLQPKEVEEILDQYAKDSANYGNNPAIDEINTLKHEIQHLTKASEILSAIRRRREIGHRLVGFHPRILGPWNKWIRTLEQYKINDQISQKHRTTLLADLDEWVATLEGGE